MHCHPVGARELALQGGTAHHCAFSVNIMGPPDGQGFQCPPCSVSVKRWGWRSDRTLGTLLVVSRDGYGSPHSICIAPSWSVWPCVRSWHSHRLLKGSAEDIRCWESVFEAVTCRSLSNPPFAFPTPYSEKP